MFLRRITILSLTILLFSSPAWGATPAKCDFSSLVPPMKGLSPKDMRDFVVAKIHGSDTGDGEFNEIALNDRLALLRTGTFEREHYLYEVRPTDKGFDLIPLSTEYGRPGKPIHIEISGGRGNETLYDALAKGHNGLVIHGSPEGDGLYTASEFKPEERDIHEMVPEALQASPYQGDYEAFLKSLGFNHVNELSDPKINTKTLAGFIHRYAGKSARERIAFLEALYGVDSPELNVIQMEGWDWDENTFEFLLIHDVLKPRSGIADFVRRLEKLDPAKIKQGPALVPTHVVDADKPKLDRIIAALESDPEKAIRDLEQFLPRYVGYTQDSRKAALDRAFGNATPILQSLNPEVSSSQFVFDLVQHLKSHGTVRELLPFLKALRGDPPMRAQPPVVPVASGGHSQIDISTQDLNALLGALSGQAVPPRQIDIDSHDLGALLDAIAKAQGKGEPQAPATVPAPSQIQAQTPPQSATTDVASPSALLERLDTDPGALQDGAFFEKVHQALIKELPGKDKDREAFFDRVLGKGKGRPLMNSLGSALSTDRFVFELLELIQRRGGHDTLKSLLKAVASEPAQAYTKDRWESAVKLIAFRIGSGQELESSIYFSTEIPISQYLPRKATLPEKVTYAVMKLAREGKLQEWLDSQKDRPQDFQLALRELIQHRETLLANEKSWTQVPNPEGGKLTSQNQEAVKALLSTVSRGYGLREYLLGVSEEPMSNIVPDQTNLTEQAAYLLDYIKRNQLGAAFLSRVREVTPRRTDVLPPLSRYFGT